MIWFIAFLLVTAGIVLKVSARFAGRIGTAPHCKRCGYRLTGIDSDRCPECGAELAKGNVVVGRRPAHRGQKRLGLASLLAGLLIFAVSGYRKAQQTNWYHYRPADWLIDEALSDATSRHLAWAEIERRCQAKEWSADADARLIAAGLVEHAEPADAGVVSAGPLLEYLDKRFAADALTTEQVDQFLDHMLVVRLDVRSRVTQGDMALCELTVDTARLGTPAPDSLMVVLQRRLLLDGKPLRDASLESRLPQPLNGFHSSIGAGHTVNVLGQHAIAASLKIEFYRTTVEDGQTSRMLVKIRDFELKAPFEVVDPKVEDPVTFLSEPSADAIRQTIDVRLQRFAINQENVSAEVEFKRPPVNLAFDILLRSGGVEVQIGRTTARPNQWVTTYLTADLESLPNAEQVDVVLRSSRDAAARTLDLYQIWGGEIVIPDVAVTRQKRWLEE